MEHIPVLEDCSRTIVRLLSGPVLVYMCRHGASTVEDNKENLFNIQCLFYS